ncbi:hypothetical protein TWF281_003688 [Arthrobotrys megalospora]
MASPHRRYVRTRDWEDMKESIIALRKKGSTSHQIVEKLKQQNPDLVLDHHHLKYLLFKWGLKTKPRARPGYEIGASGLGAFMQQRGLEVQRKDSPEETVTQRPKPTSLPFYPSGEYLMEIIEAENIEIPVNKGRGKDSDSESDSSLTEHGFTWCMPTNRALSPNHAPSDSSTANSGKDTEPRAQSPRIIPIESVPFFSQIEEITKLQNLHRLGLANRPPQGSQNQLNTVDPLVNLTGLLPVDPEGGANFSDTQSVYSDWSFTASVEEGCSPELVDKLYREAGKSIDFGDINTIDRACRALPELLKIFVLEKLHVHQSSLRERHAALFVYKNCKKIADSFRETCEREMARTESQSSITSPLKTTAMTVDEKMDLWHGKSESDAQAPVVHLAESSSGSNQGTYNLHELHENETKDELAYRDLDAANTGHEEVDHLGLHHTDDSPSECIAIESEAFKGLIARLRSEVLLVSMPADRKAEIKAKIMRHLSRGISKYRSPKIFNATFLTEWKPDVFFQQQGYGDSPANVLDEVITLTGGPVHAEPSEPLTKGSAWDAQALTCAQYIHQTWPVTGKYFITAIKEILSMCYCSGYRYKTTSAPAGPYLIAASATSSGLHVTATGTKYFVVEIGQQLAWLGAALTSCLHKGGVITCQPLLFHHVKPNQPNGIPVPLENLQRKRRVLSSFPGPRVNPELEDNRIRNPVQPLDPDQGRRRNDVSYGLIFAIQGLRDNHLSDSRCWKDLFNKPVIVEGYPILRRINPGTGLEMPLNMMVGLARTKYLQTSLDGKFLIKGFSTLLVPTRKDEDVIVWHLICNIKGDRIPYYAALKAGLPYPEGINGTDLTLARHVLGWCPEFKYYAGAADASYNIRPSQLSRPPEGCVFNGIRISGKRIITGGFPFAIGQKDTPYHLTRISSLKKLQWIHENFFVFWDEEDKRGWLINGTSTLLHLLRTSLENDSNDDFNFEFCFDKTKFQEAKYTHKPYSAISVLLNDTNLQQEIFPENGDYVRVKDRLEDIYDTLEKIIDHQASVDWQAANSIATAGKYVEGWDFIDIASSSTRDPIFPRAGVIRKDCASWIDFTKDIHAVTLFGRGFGEIIQPSSIYECIQWARLPKGDYFLAASVKDLKKAVGINGCYSNTPVKLATHLICPNSNKRFEECKCNQGSETVGYAEPLQDFSLFELSDLHPDNLSKDDGAIILNSKWQWGDSGVATSDIISPPPRDSEILSHGDSGIGSSLDVPLSYEDYKVGIVCALPKEMLAVHALFDQTHENLEHVPGDTNHYTFGSIEQHNVVTACLPSGEYGTCAAADVLTNMRRSFTDLDICLLVGIGGGVPSEKHDIRLGDVVVSDPTGGYPGVIQYDFVKTLENGESEKIGTLQPPPRFIRTAISALRSKLHLREDPLGVYLKHIESQCPEYKYPGYEHDQDGGPAQRAARRNRRPKIHYGLIASGNQVMKDSQTRDRIAQKYGVLCFEMEAAGVMNTHDCLVVRGICDYSDSRKNDIWQEYAAATAAAYVKHLLFYVRTPSRAPSNRGFGMARSNKREGSFEFSITPAKKGRKASSLSPE